MPQISIVVPVYNAEKYLPDCIDSLLSQTLKDIEIILVNDGSKDSSLEICQEYSEKDHRIQIISKKNEGVAKARRDGIASACADYIAFIDSDDYYEPYFCEKMLSRMKLTNADMVECDYYTAIGDIRREHRVYESDMGLDAEEFRKVVVKKNIVNGTEAVVLWNKLYRKEFIAKTVKEFGGNQLEDYIFNAQYYTLVKRYEYIHQCLTNYRQVPTSLSRGLDLKTLEVLKQAETIRQQCMEQMGLNTPDNLADAASWFTRYVQNYLLRLMLSKQDNKKQLVLQVVQDPMVQQQCVRADEQSGFTRAVGAGRGKAAVLCIQKKACLLRLKQFGAKCKRILHR